MEGAKPMSEVFNLMHQAGEVVQTAKDAMEHALPADKTTESLAREILSEAKTLLPGSRILQSINFPVGDISWVSVRSAMQAVHQALSQAHSEQLRAANRAGASRIRYGNWS